MEKTYEEWEIETMNRALLIHNRVLLNELSLSKQIIEHLRADFVIKNQNLKRGRPLGSKNKARVKK